MVVEPAAGGSVVGPAGRETERKTLNMHELVTIAKVRKATKLTVPAGGWVLLLGPDRPLNEHLSLRVEAMESYPVNNSEAEIIVGRVAPVAGAVKFITSAEASKREQELAEHNAQLRQSDDDAKERQRKMDAEKAAKAQADHERRVREINAQNDSIRFQGLSADQIAEVKRKDAEVADALAKQQAAAPVQEQQQQNAQVEGDGQPAAENTTESNQ